MFGQERALMVLVMRAKCGVQEKSGSPDTGPFVTPKRLFRVFLENFKTVLGFFLSKGGPYGPSSVCQVWSPGKIWFSRYGAKRVSNGGQNGFFWALLEFSRKVDIRFCSCLVSKGPLWSFKCVPSVDSRKNLVL